QTPDCPPVDTFHCYPDGNGTIRWVRREALVEELKQRLRGKCRVLSLVGLTGIGKTALGLKLQQDLATQFSQSLAIRFDVEQNGLNQLFQPILGRTIAVGEGSKAQVQTLVPELVQVLQSKPHLLVLDMVEVLLQPDSAGYQFRDAGFRDFFDWVVKVDTFASRIILTSQDQPPRPDSGRYPDRAHLQLLSGLDLAESLALFEQWQVIPQNTEEEDYLQRIIQAYEGHPLALRVMAGEIGEVPYGGRVSAYWAEVGGEIERLEQLKQEPTEKGPEDRPRLDRLSVNLSELVQRRIEQSIRRLWQQDYLAGRMLCEGSVYRRAVEQRAWLLMVEEYGADREAQLRAFQTLQRRYLLEFEAISSGAGYRLHSLVRRVAADALAEIDDEISSLEDSSV
ncbi:MAG: NB-ARC domain-containing protein, partial [Prochlorothrix sp.]